MGIRQQKIAGNQNTTLYLKHLFLSHVKICNQNQQGWIPWFYSKYLIYLRTLYDFDQHSGLSKVSNLMDY